MQADAVVYVIDDDEAVRDSLSFLFKAAGLAAQTYESATSFLNHLPRVKAGCIVTDVRMPGLSGLDLLRRLKELRSTVPVIVITGHGDVPLAVEAMKSGAADFLEKPFDDEALLAAVNVALRDQGASAKRDADRADIIERLAPGGLLAISALSEVGASPGPFRVTAGELGRAFAALERIAAGEGDSVAWLLARG